MRGRDLTALKVTVEQLKKRSRYHRTLCTQCHIRAKRTKHGALAIMHSMDAADHADIVRMLDRTAGIIAEIHR